MLEKEGYPFKSKEHSQRWSEFEKHGLTPKHTQRYLGMYKRPNDTDETVKRYMCPKTLMYQFTDDFLESGIKISDKCCEMLKEKPLHDWQNENKKPYGIIGIMKDEGGRRNLAKCVAFKSKNRMNFQPLVAITKEWEDWFIEEYDIRLADLYYEPYMFDRTGCRGCPFALHLQEELDTLAKFFPNELKVCESVWKPVYDEYRRIGYRLRKPDGQMTLDDYLDKEENNVSTGDVL